MFQARSKVDLATVMLTAVEVAVAVERAAAVSEVPAVQAVPEANTFEAMAPPVDTVIVAQVAVGTFEAEVATVHQNPVSLAVRVVPDAV